MVSAVDKFLIFQGRPSLSYSLYTSVDSTAEQNT